MSNIRSIISSLPPVSEVIRAYKLAPQKALGQNFLRDQFITDQILGAIPSIKGKRILEVGPGPGGLTRSILSQEPLSLHAIEYDRRCVDALASISALLPDQFHIIQADALNFDYSSLGEIDIIANLPYNIGTQLVSNWLLNYSNIKSLTVMLQREVVDRMIATPGSKDYGRLSVICSLRAEMTKLFDIEPEFFFPPPKVVSSVIHFQLKPHSQEIEYQKLERLISLLFVKRRKMLRSILNNFDFAALGIDATLRPEELSPQDFINIAKHLT